MHEGDKTFYNKGPQMRPIQSVFYHINTKRWRNRERNWQIGLHAHNDNEAFFNQRLPMNTKGKDENKRNVLGMTLARF